MFIYHSMEQSVQSLFYNLSHVPWVCGGLEPTGRDEEKKVHTETNVLGVAHMRCQFPCQLLVDNVNRHGGAKGGVETFPHMNYLYPLTNSDRSPAADDSPSQWTD